MGKSVCGVSESKEVVCILGMHRCGTSVVARLANLLGLNLGPRERMIQPGFDNPKGFWENFDLTHLNEDILGLLGGDHLHPPCLAAEWETSPKFAGAFRRARSIIERDFAGAETWGWKDPRNSLTLPFWQVLLPKMKYVICLRNPTDVARSLLARNSLSLEAGLALWLRYAQSAIANTEGGQSILLFFEDIMDDPWQESGRLSHFLYGVDRTKAVGFSELASDFIDRNLRHHCATVQDESDLPELIRSMYLNLRARVDSERQEFQNCRWSPTINAKGAPEGPASVYQERVVTSSAPNGVGIHGTISLEQPNAEPVTIVFVSHDAGRAGAQRFLIVLIRWLRDHCGVNPRVVLRRGGPLAAEFAELGSVFDVEPLLQCEPRELKDRLLGFCHGADLIYINTLVPGDIAQLLSELGMPIVTHAHELEHAIERWCPPDHLRHVLALSDHFIAASRPVAANLVKKYGLEAKRVSTIHSFIDSSHQTLSDEGKRISRKVKHLPQDGFIVFACGTLEWRKGPDLFLQVARIVIEDCKLSDAHFYWIGPETHEFRRKDFETLIKAMAFEPQVHYLGEVEHPRDYFSAGDLFLLTSREDPFPLVCLEAADQGLPILCFDEAGGMPDFVRDDAGHVTPFYDVRAMAEKIVTMHSNAEKRRRAGEVALHRVRSEYNTSAGAGKVLNTLLRRAFVHSRARSVALDGQIAELKTRQQELTARVVELESNVATREQELAHKETAIAQDRARLASLGEKIGELETHVQEQSESLTEKESQLARAAAREIDLNRLVSELQTEVTDKASLLTDTEAQVKRLSEAGASLRSSVTKLEGEVSAQETTILRMSQEADALRAHQDELERESAVKVAVVAKQQAQIAALNQRSQEITQNLDDLQNELAEINKIQSGILWKLFIAVRQSKDRLFPPGSRRRGLYDDCLSFIKGSRSSSEHPSRNVLSASPLSPSLPLPGSSEKLFFALDSIAVRSGRAYGWGWVFHEELSISAVRLGVELGRGIQYFSCQYNISRQDVADGHRSENARKSGFLIQCRLPVGALFDMFLEVDLARGETRRLDFEQFRAFLGKDSGGSRSDGVQRIRRYGKKSLEYLARGDLRLLYKKARRKIEHIRSEAESSAFVFDEFSKSIERVKHRDFTLLVDHNMGGGTNHYRRRFVQERLVAGRPVVLLTYDVWRLRYTLKVHDGEREAAHYLESLDVLNKLASTIKIREIFLNNVVSFEDPLLLITLLLHLRQETGAELVFAVHDYFAICPSWTLLDDRGRHCAIPALERCRECLPRLHRDLAFWVDKENVDQWRMVWSQCLTQADRILAFSQSSIELLCRAFPDLNRAKIYLEPHSMEDFPVERVSVNLGYPLHIGIVGEISYAKGAAIVRKMAQLIEDRHLPVRISVIGTIEGGCDGTVVQVTGPYVRHELPETIRRSGANVFFVPAIWPETFSYVTAELMSLGVPVAAFNLGAQAERLAAYDRGRVIHDVTSEGALEELIAFHAMLRRAQPTSGLFLETR